MRTRVYGVWFRLTVVVIGLSLAGYADSPKYHDPFDPVLSPTAQSVVGQAPTAPSIRVILTGSTAASMKALTDWCNLGRKLLNPGSFIDPYDPRHFQEDLNRILSPRFRSIEYVYWNAPESRSQVDYVLTLEISVTIGRHAFGKNHVELQGVLSGPDGGQKENFTGHGESKVGMFSSAQFSEGRLSAFNEFAQGMSSSRLLAAYKNSAEAPSGSQTALAQTSSSNAASANVAVRSGLYEVESKIHFNVLDSVYYDAASGELALIGHHDDRFKDEGIPYLQHLATLLENPKPEFSLTWTPDSGRQVDALLARELTQRESDEQGGRLGAMVDSSGQISHTGTLMLPALGIYPINDNRAPGDLGVEVMSWNGRDVLVMKVKPGSAAEKAGLKPNDLINSVRPDRPVLFAMEFERQVRFAGAGAVIVVSYLRDGEWHTAKVTLDAAVNADPWHEVNRYDVIGTMYRAAGDRRAADVVESMGIMNSAITLKEQKSGLETYTLLMHSLGMDSEFKHLQEVGATSAPPYADSYNFGLTLSRQLDSIFHLAGSPIQNAFESAVQQTHEPASGVVQAFNEFDRQFVPKFKELLDPLIFRPGVGFQVPPELVEDEYHIHPEMTPEYLGVPRDSQLARLMLTSDYLGKQLDNRQDLKRKIPGYQTQVEYQINHPETVRRNNTAYRVWISVAGIDAAQSTNGRMLALREAKMRFNIRETDNQHHELPNQQPDGYENVLTGFYDQFAQEFPILHELREAAKLAAVALWMQKQSPAVHLPDEGRATWKGPDKVAGLVYIYFTVNLRHESKIIKMAEGGVSLVPRPVGNSAVFFPVDPSVVDLRSSSAMATVFTRPDTATLRDAVADNRAGTSPYVAGWVAPVDNGRSGQEAVVVVTGPFGTKNSQPNLTAADKNAGAVGQDTSPNRQLNATAQNDKVLAKTPGTGEAGSADAQLGFDTGVKSAGAVDASAVKAPPTAAEDLQIPASTLEDPAVLKAVLALNSYKQQAKQSHEAAAAAQTALETEQKKDPHSAQLVMLLEKAKEAKDKAGSLDNMVKVQTAEVKEKIKFSKFNTGEDGSSEKTPPSASPPPPPPPSPKKKDESL